MGIDVDRAHRIAFALGVGITAIAGGLLATNYPFQPFVGSTTSSSCTPASCSAAWAASSARSGAGMTDRPGAAALDAGPADQLQNTAIFVVFLLIVFFRPQGFFGRASERT